MSEIQTLPIPGEEPRNGFLQRLMDPTVDRTIAIVAVLPMVWAAYYRYHHFGLNLPVIYYFMNTLCLCSRWRSVDLPSGSPRIRGSGCWRL